MQECSDEAETEANCVCVDEQVATSRKTSWRERDVQMREWHDEWHGEEKLDEKRKGKNTQLLKGAKQMDFEFHNLETWTH